MMESGDPTLEQLAGGFVLFSTAHDLRRATLEAHLNGQPNVEIWVDGGKFDKKAHKDFAYEVRKNKGSVADGTKGFFNFKVGEKDAGKGCWVYSYYPSICYIRLSEESVSLNIFGKWPRLSLDDSSVLRGQVEMRRVDGGIPVSIAVTR